MSIQKVNSVASRERSYDYAEAAGKPRPTPKPADPSEPVKDDKSSKRKSRK